MILINRYDLFYDDIHFCVTKNDVMKKSRRLRWAGHVGLTHMEQFRDFVELCLRFGLVCASDADLCVDCMRPTQRSEYFRTVTLYYIGLLYLFLCSAVQP